MDLDRAVVSALISEGLPSVRAAAERGLSPLMLFGEGKITYTFVTEYLREYRELPTLEIITGKTGITLTPVEGKAAFFVEEIFNRQLQGELGPKLVEWTGYLEQLQPRLVLENIEQTLRSIRNDYKTGRVEQVTALGKEVWAEYERMREGAMGIPFPWPTLTEHTLGLWPEDLMIFVARVGTGKTWSGLMIAEHAWRSGYRVLFVTTEMSRIAVARRFFALHLKLPYKDFRMGKLGNFADDRVQKEIMGLSEKDGLYLVGGDFNFTFEGLEAAIDEAEPDLLVVDGAYLMKSEGTNRTERAAGAFDELKRVSKRNKISTVATSQFNREVKGNLVDSIQIEKIALTDAASWNADGVVALIQTEDMRRDKRLQLKALKNREGVLGDPLELCWDFQQMCFDEVPKKGGGDADEFGSGLNPLPPDVAPPSKAPDPSGNDMPF